MSQAPFGGLCVLHRSPESAGSQRCKVGRDQRLGDALKDEEEGSWNSTGPTSVRGGWGVAFWFGLGNHQAFSKQGRGNIFLQKILVILAF